jgi:lysozyme family protein
MARYRERRAEMAMSLEELTAGVVESVGAPWAVALGAGAVAMWLVRRAGRVPDGRVDGVAKQTVAQSSWLDSLRRGWHSLVDEARSEYEATRSGTPVSVTAVRPGARKAPRRAAGAAAARTRDRSGRFTARSASANGSGV